MRIQQILIFFRDLALSQVKEVLHALKILTPEGFRKFGQSRSFFKELMQVFYVEGGLAVITEAPNATNEEVPVIRTVIQPDGDILSFLTPVCFEQTEYWDLHRQAIIKELKRFKTHITQFKLMCYGLANLASVLISTLGLYAIWRDSFSFIGWFKTFLPFLVWGIMLVILRWVLPRIGFYFIRRKLPIAIRIGS